jgi:DNA-binding MarR family transcriptional regulator
MTPVSATTSNNEAEAAELAGRLRLSVTRLARLMRQQADTGLSPTQLATLATVEAAGPVTLGDLAAREQVAPPTMTKAVACLEGQGLVDRHQDRQDRRVSRLSITAEGRRLLERSRTRKNAWLARRLSALDAGDRERLAEALDALERLTR